MREAVIVEAVRTPLGRGKQTGALYPVHAVDLAADTLKALVERTGLDPALVEDVIMGCVSQVGEQGLNVGRNAALAAGFPGPVCGTTVDRQCGSSQQSLHFAAQGVIAGAYDVVIAAGVESMSRVPMGTSVGIGGAALRADDDEALHRAEPLRRRRARAAGHLGRDHRREMEALARGARRVLGRLAPEGRRGDAERLVQERDRARRGASTPTAAATSSPPTKASAPDTLAREARAR